MISFLCSTRPVSVNAKSTTHFKQVVIDAYKKQCVHKDTLLNDELYGIVYYFHKRKTELDADNLSKPIWDALENVVYDNDRIIKLRYSGIYDISKPDSIYEINTERMSKTVLDEFMKLIDDNDHIIYIELGRLSNNLYVLGVEENA
jgi:Holliday junction resolvase RusA-like endonuclease